MLCRFEFSTSFPATREAEDSKYLTSTHLHPATATRMGGVRRCECTKWYVRSYRLTQVMQVLRQLDSFRGSLTLVNPSSASLVVNQFDVLALSWYTRRLAQLINPPLAEPRGNTRPSRQVPGRNVWLQVSPLYSFQHCLVSLSSFCASLLLFTLPPSLVQPLLPPDSVHCTCVTYFVVSACTHVGLK